MSTNKSIETIEDINKLILDNRWVPNRMMETVSVESYGIAMHNAVAAQRNAQILNTAIVAAACNRILAIRPARQTGEE